MAPIRVCSENQICHHYVNFEMHNGIIIVRGQSDYGVRLIWKTHHDKWLMGVSHIGIWMHTIQGDEYVWWNESKSFVNNRVCKTSIAHKTLFFFLLKIKILYYLKYSYTHFILINLNSGNVPLNLIWFELKLATFTSFHNLFWIFIVILYIQLTKYNCPDSKTQITCYLNYIHIFCFCIWNKVNLRPMFLGPGSIHLPYRPPNSLIEWV